MVRTDIEASARIDQNHRVNASDSFAPTSMESSQNLMSFAKESSQADEFMEQIKDDKMLQKNKHDEERPKQREVDERDFLLTHEHMIMDKLSVVEELAPLVITELNAIDTSMQRVLDLIRPHTSMNRAANTLPLFRQTFDVYKQCLQYKRVKLCQMLEQDKIFWEEKAEQCAKAK